MKEFSDQALYDKNNSRGSIYVGEGEKQYETDGNPSLFKKIGGVGLMQ
jgi:hypothetical protein